ncbi:ABC transporter substrate-binding protein [Humitalea sp. 24SJ18S-53]|uniref:ABC transporter substrate-binding protein n=1 Tax=Humitalea sp. 24SJ18S-53 TaxID=3422307 RepID=UPI003D66D396
MLAAAVVGGLARPAIAQPRLEPVRFSCDFRIYGGTAPFIYGVEKGFFRDVGIDARVDGSSGSADAVRRVASGAYEFGCADASTLVEFTARNPAAAPKLIMPIYDRFAAAIVSIQPNGITSLEGLRGRTLGTGTADAPSRILPALLRLKGIDIQSINRQTVDVALRDTMLIQRRVDAVVGFDYTVLFNLLGGGVKLDDTRLVYFTDNGFDFFGQGLIVNNDVLQRSPDLARRMAIAITRCWLGAAQDPEGATDAVVRREPLSDRAVELARLKWVLDRLVLTPNVRANGLGTMNIERLRKGIEIIAEGFQIQTPPTVEQIFDGRFIPDAALRRVV